MRRRQFNKIKTRIDRIHKTSMNRFKRFSAAKRKSLATYDHTYSRLFMRKI